MRFLFWKTLLGLLLFDSLFLGRHFASLHRIVSTWRLRGKEPAPGIAEEVCNVMNQVCIWYPKRVLCLQRSAVTTCLLRSCGIPAQMVLGAQKLPFKAHAWVEVNGQALNEMSDVQSIYGVWDRC